MSRATIDIKKKEPSLDLSIAIEISKASDAIKRDELSCEEAFEEKEDYSR